KKNGPEGDATPQGPTATTGTEKITKKEAVRRSLAKLGQDAKPALIRADIKERFGIEMTPAHITTTKGELRRQAAKGKAAPRRPPGRPPKAKAEADPAQRHPPAPAPAERGSSTGATVLLEDIQTLKSLVKRVGADHLKTLIDLLSR